MKSKLFPSEVYLLRKRVNLSSESSQLFSDERVNQIRMSKQVFKNTRPKKSQPFSGKDTDLKRSRDTNIALNVLIDIAEEQGISIRKKAGAKQ